MTKYIEKELAKYWPVSGELMAQYMDGSHTYKDRHGLYWRRNSLRHRDGDKPAIIWADGSLQWFKNSQLHRFGGPAIIYPNGKLSWWINGANITQEVIGWLNGEEWQGTPEQIVEFQLRFL